MEKYICLKKSDVIIPTEGEEESSSDEDDGDDDEDEDEGDEEDGEASDDVPDTAKRDPVDIEIKVEEVVEGKEEDVSEPFSCVWRMLTCGLGSTH